MPSIKEYNDKLHSLKNTQKMTKTMQMVSASKLRKAQEAQRNSKPYATYLREMISRLAASVDAASHPLLTPRNPVRRVHLMVLTSDKGLCGAFNNGVIKYAERWQREHYGEYDEVQMSFCARRGYAYFRNKAMVKNYFEGATAAPTFTTANGIARHLTREFLDGEFDEVYLVYNEFKSALSQTPVLRKLLPVEPEEVLGQASSMSTEYIFEPSRKELLASLLPKTVSFKLYFALLDNAAGEHGARMTAMDNATTNAANLIERYTLMRNRARQAAITTELIEIVAGAEAL
jgi:F-type H+-transporting ATPase subunit gamma